jgi:hypothetical protein
MDTGFSTPDITDGRTKLEWESKYPKEAQKHIIFDCVYLTFFLIGMPILALVAYLEILPNLFALCPKSLIIIKPYFMVWFGGAFGGALFGIKWTYHCIAKQQWHIDRRPWRLLIPIMAGSLAFVFFVLMRSGLMNIFDSNSLQKPTVAFGIGFLVGYFSDNAIAKLVEVANTFFGVTKHQ